MLVNYKLRFDYGVVSWSIQRWKSNIRHKTWLELEPRDIPVAVFPSNVLKKSTKFRLTRSTVSNGTVPLFSDFLGRPSSSFFGFHSIG